MNDNDYYKSCGSVKLNRVFCQACSKGDLNEIKYILTEPELEKKIDIHRNNDVAFLWALAGLKIKIIKYFIFEYNIDMTDSITAQLKDEGLISKEISTEIKQMFELRELNDSLKKDLEQKEIKVKKNKI